MQIQNGRIERQASLIHKHKQNPSVLVIQHRKKYQSFNIKAKAIEQYGHNNRRQQISVCQIFGYWLQGFPLTKTYINEQFSSIRIR